MIDEEKGEPPQPKLKPLNDATRYALADVLENGSLTPQQISVMMQGNQKEEQDETEQMQGRSPMMAGRK